ncbi:hypothetical protein DMC30DRAFT_123549 [Rhodotorula diobovata]|uniref:Uncharacterized protein n=1 Tax=Rhodotorula diobovata TaxID=5288 RepID=A0A5C5G0U2_9BASI|nr:hypothetical protein DMC30DRAFT_123549 [Rhodotorula diobovata]
MLEPPRASTRRSSVHTKHRRPPTAAPSAAASPLADLRRLERYCHATSDRCSALEHSLSRVEHDVQSRITQWDSHLETLASVDDRAQALTAQLTAQLAALRTVADPQVAAARSAVGESKARVGDSDATLDKSIDNVERARLKLDDLQRQFEDKEAALERAESWLSWLTGLAIILVAVLSVVAAYVTHVHRSI